MLFPPETNDKLAGQWDQLIKLRAEATNGWCTEWDAPLAEFESHHALAREKDTPETWRAVAVAGRKLREAMRDHRFDPDYHPPYFEKLTDFTDAIEATLEAAGHIPANVIPPERDELIERITRLEKQVDEETRRTVLEKPLREQLDRVAEDLAKSKRTLIKIDHFNVVNIDPASIVALIRDALEALKHGVDLLTDKRFTEGLRKQALAAWLSAKRLVRAIRRRFADLKFPWKQEEIFREFEGPEPDLHLPHTTMLPSFRSHRA